MYIMKRRDDPNLCMCTETLPGGQATAIREKLRRHFPSDFSSCDTEGLIITFLAPLYHSTN